MTKLPRLTARDIVRRLEYAGFLLVWQSGSHRIYKDISGRRVTVPFHDSKILHPKILKNILQDSGIVL